MPTTTWSVRVGVTGSKGARTLARDLRDLDGVLKDLGKSSGVLKSIASDAAAIRGARVRVGAERRVGDEGMRQRDRLALADARRSQNARTELTDSERMRRAVADGQVVAARNEQRDRLRTWQQRSREEDREARRVRVGRDRWEAGQQRRNAALVTGAARRDQALITRNHQREVRERARAERQSEKRRSEAIGSVGAGLGVAFGAATAISAATMGALGFITDMVSAVARLTLGLGSAVLEMVAFRESTLTTLRAMARDNTGRRLTGRAADTQAHEQLRFAQQFARETPLDVGDVVDIQRQSSAAGFYGNDNRRAVLAAADVGAFNQADPTASRRFMLGLGQLRNASSVRTQDLRQTAEAAGLGENDILREIARRAGQTQRTGEADSAYNGRIQAMQRAGRFTGAQGVEGVLGALQARNGGELGSFARAQGSSLAGTLSNLRGAALDFVTSIEDIENLPGIRNLKSLLNDIVRALTGSGPTATRLKAIFASLVNTSAQWVSELGGEEGVFSLINRVLDSAERLYPVVLDVVRAFGGEAWKAFSEGIAPLVSDLGDATTNGDDMVNMAGLLGNALGILLSAGIRVTVWLAEFVGHLAIGAAFVIQIVDAIRGFISTIGELISAPWTGIGSMIVDGMREGFLGPSQGFVSEVGNWSNDIANASRANLGVHSPSRVFRDIGLQIPAGMALGIDSGARDVERSLGSMVAPPTLGDFAGPGALAGLGAMGGISAVFNITVNGGATNETGEAIGEAAWSAFVDRFEQANAMAGG